MRFTLSEDVSTAIPRAMKSFCAWQSDFASRFKPLDSTERQELLVSAKGLTPIFTETQGRQRSRSARPGLFAQFHDRRSCTTLSLRRGIETADMRVRTEKFPHGAFQHSHSMTMNDADPIYRSECRRIQKLINLLDSFLRALPDDVQLPIRNIPARAGL